MREIRDFILTVIAATIIGFCSHIWYLENIHTHNSGETIPPASVASSPESFLKTETMRVSAYCLCRKCCNSWAVKGVNSKGQRITASGHVIKPGDRFVAAPKNIPFGTMLIVPGYANGRPVPVLDRGGVIKGNRLDAYFPSHTEALKWGVKNIVVQREN
jgi:3D (Asp-Asp-Asp) domain-containing protein